MRYRWLSMLAVSAACLVTLAAPASAQGRQQWALIVGVSDYPGQIQDLNYPKSDATAVRDVLVKSAGFKAANIRLLTDDAAGELKATRANIYAAVDNYLGTRVKAGDQVVVFLAGHGISRGLGAQAKGYFLPADVDASSKESLESTSVELTQLGQKLGALQANQFTMFIDACREDPFPGRGVKGNLMTDVMSRSLRVVAEESGERQPPTAVIFYSCEIGQRAYEDPMLEHGVFTYFIIDGVKKLAEAPDGRVDAGRLAAHLQSKVGEWTKEFSARAKFQVEQTPTLVTSEVRGPVTVVRVSPVAKQIPPAPTLGTATLITSPEGATLSLNGQALGAGPIRKELSPGDYTIRAEMSGYEATETKIKIVAGVPQEVTITLKPAATAMATMGKSYEAGLKAEAQELWPQAIVAYELAVQENPSTPAPFERLANAYLKTSRYQDAVDTLWLATAKFADNGELMAKYSRALAQWSGLTDEALDKSDKERPKPADKKNKLVSRKDARKESLEAANAAVKLAPQLPAAHLALGYAQLLQKGGANKAQQAFGKASLLAPEDAEAYYGVGYALRVNKQFPEAVPQLKKALELRPDYYDAHRELAYCYTAIGDTDKATRQYETASGYVGETNDAGEMAGINLALSSLYTQKGKALGGTQGAGYELAATAYQSQAKEYDPTLKAALKSLVVGGVSGQLERFFPSDIRGILGGLLKGGLGGILGGGLPF